MAAFDLTELDKSIESFQETIEALKEIQSINQKLNDVADKIGAQDATLKADAERLQKAYNQINFALDDLKGSARAYTADIRTIFKEQKSDLGALQHELIEASEKSAAAYIERADQMEKTIAGKLQANVDSVKTSTQNLTTAVKENMDTVKSFTETVLEKTESTERAVLDYATSTQKSIDELRMMETNNARETRDKIVETDARARAEMDNRFKTVEQLTTELAAMRAQQKKAQIMGAVGGISAILAALSSVLHFFF